MANGNIITKPKMRHVYGNVLRIAVPMILRRVEVVDGVVTTSDSDFIPSSQYPVAIEFTAGAQRYKLIASKEGNVATVTDNGTIPVGTYAITVMCKDSNGNPFRYKEHAVLEVVDSTKEAGIKEGIEYEVLTNYLESALFFASGADGKGMIRIETVVGEHSTTMTYHYSDGTSQSFDVISGIEQVVDQDWDIHSSRAIANRVVTGFRDYVLDKDMYVTEETLNIEW